MEIIITHLNADFDALASMLAAKKLYPSAKLVFPGSQEKSLRDFLVRSTFYVFESEKLKDVDVDKVERMIVVDTRQRSRIGKFAELLDRGVEVHIYDHHPSSPDDFHGTVEVVQEKGATVTVLLPLLRERGVEITPEEATVMLLGIYEDTGSLTFPNTTEDDFYAAAYLFSKGASLNIISDMITKELTAEQIFLLNDLIRNAERYQIKGVEVVITTATAGKYIGDVALLVHKFKDMENLNVVFALIRMEDRVYLIARSRLEEVNVAEVAGAFGGGGHSTAASATIKDFTLPEAKERLLKIVPQVIKPVPIAKEMMTSPLRTIQEEAPLEEAYQVMAHYNIGVLPVLKDGRLVGLITKEIASRAVFHGLGGQKVKEYMITDFSTVSPDAPLKEIQDHIVGEGQKLLPVVDGGKLIGGITKTDLLRALHETPSFSPSPLYAKKKFITRLLEERVPPHILDLLRRMGEVGEEMGYRIYAVGGFVRDLLLRRPTHDVDVVVEGDGIRFAQAFGEKTGLKVRIHKKMGTATVLFPNGYRIDVATARMEYYPRPAAPPTVDRGPLKMDLFRRDFTINTLAVQLNPPSFGQLIDFFGAQRDLKEGVIRVLHSLSFVEDPSRIFRALRFEVRFGFQIGKQTQNLIRGAVKMGFVDRLSGARLFAELVLILTEEDPLPIIERMEEFGLLRVLHPRLSLTPFLKGLLRRVGEVIHWYDLLFLEGKYEKWMVYLLAMADPLKEKEVRELSERLALSPRHRKRLLEGRRRALRTMGTLGDMFQRPMEVYRLLSPLEDEVLLYMMAKATKKEVKKAISLFITQWRQTRVSLNGKDLQEMGIPPGPIYREIFERLLEARLEGEVETESDERELVRREFLPSHSKRPTKEKASTSTSP